MLHQIQHFESIGDLTYSIVSPDFHQKVVDFFFEVFLRGIVYILIIYYLIFYITIHS